MFDNREAGRRTTGFVFARGARARVLRALIIKTFPFRVDVGQSGQNPTARGSDVRFRQSMDREKDNRYASCR